MLKRSCTNRLRHSCPTIKEISGYTAFRKVMFGRVNNSFSSSVQITSPQNSHTSSSTTSSSSLFHFFVAFCAVPLCVSNYFQQWYIEFLAGLYDMITAFLTFFLFHQSLIKDQRFFDIASSDSIFDNSFRYNITFNYETNNINKTVSLSSKRYGHLGNENGVVIPQVIDTINLIELPASAVRDIHALCFPSKSRPNGCQPLLLSQGMLTSKKRHSSEQVKSLPPLPCVSGQSCPYKKFRCTKGHEWKVSFRA